MKENVESPAEEYLKNENKFLKMKFILEQGAQCETMQNDTELPASVENGLLNLYFGLEVTGY